MVSLKDKNRVHLGDHIRGHDAGPVMPVINAVPFCSGYCLLGRRAIGTDESSRLHLEWTGGEPSPDGSFGVWAAANVAETNKKDRRRVESFEAGSGTLTASLVKIAVDRVATINQKSPHPPGYREHGGRSS